VLPCCPDGCMLSWQNLPDTEGRQNETRDLTFAELETVQNLPGTLKLLS